MPEYEGRIVYVDVVTSEPSARPVLERYPTRYIPTSVFVGADGAVVETVMGPLTEAGLRTRLDVLAE
ncbi:MAG: hypothetical protein JXA36_00545 [Coriobacteriia bacterium]|nr:hypothetical protein [Coriobacteriia bacterium]